MMKSFAGVFLTVASVLAGSLGKTERWTVSTPEDYQKGTLENIIVFSSGELALGPTLTRHESGELSLWCSAVDEKSGTVYFGSGTEGKIYRLSPQGELHEFSKTGEVVVTALAFGGGRLYAATIPDGKIFACNLSNGEVSPFATLPDAYVWSLAALPGDTVIAGTGPDGKVYRIDSQGTASLWFETKQSHVLSLAADSSHSVYAGTSPNGVLFRIAPEGKGEVVFNTNEQEIRTLVWDKDTLWIGANKSKKFDPKKFVKRLQAAAAQAQEGEEKESPFQDLFDGSVYRLTEKSPARLVHSVTKSYAASLAVDKLGRVYLGTGDEGKVWRIDPDGTASLLAALKENQVMTLAVVNGELAAMGTGNPAAVYTLSSLGVRSGSFTSEIVDAKFPAIWGTLSWDATGSLGVQTRSGKTARPDDGTWSDWSEPIHSNTKVGSPPGRYFQVRVTWKDDPRATLRWLTLYYRTENQQPEVKEVEVEAFDQNTAFLGKLRESAEVTLRWKAADADGDELVFRVSCQREGREEWVPLLPEPTAKKDYKWDTQQAAEGWYRVKVVASDEPTNPTGSALTAMKVTRPILIDNRKPAFEEVGLKGRILSGSAVDQTSVIARLEYSIDAGPWHFLQPVDGLYDERSERFSIALSDGHHGPGVRNLSIRAVDGNGNVAVYQETFKVE